MAVGETGFGDGRWSSSTLAPDEAFRSWKSWASATLAPMQIEIGDKRHFAARWHSAALGPLRIVAFEAPAQRVTHPPSDGPARGRSSYQLLYCGRTPIASRVGAERFLLGAGECVLIDNADRYEMSIEGQHDAIDLIMPRPWLERWLPDPARSVGQPFSATGGWGLPLGSLLSMMALDLDNAALPRPMLADQLGPLLALAVGDPPATGSRHRLKLLQRAQRLIEERYADPALDPGQAAAALGISKRHLHAVFTESGSTFLEVLGRVRLDRAAEHLADRRYAGHQIAEIAWRCGYLDPSYFARVFRRRFGSGPREWRNARLR